MFSDHFLKLSWYWPKDAELITSATIHHLRISVKEQRQSIMNHNPATPAIDDAADGLNIHAFLQQAVDHYPCLAAFSFTALLPRSGTMTDNRALIMRFHTE
ncbi:hypothetical protein I6U52_25125, partial [Serratia marcescens]|nr:hypothetical protein [Serratia marcescens]